MEQALVCRAHVFPHPNADRLQLASVSGYSVVVGLETQDNELGLFFSSELRLSDEFLAAHDLVSRKNEFTGEKEGGYFAANGRVRAQSFRGVKSEGYWVPLGDLDFTGANIEVLNFKEGDTLSEVNGVPICTKYINPATLRAMRNSNQPKKRRENVFFPKHVDTDQLRHKGHFIKVNDQLTLTYKMHGTSARTGRVWETTELPRKWHQKVLRKPAKTVTELQVLTGTRNVVLADGKEDGYYIGENFRKECTARFGEAIRPGEVWYYEIVGYTGSGQPLMGVHNLSKSTDKEAHKLYGKEITYSYGCQPGEFDIYVYRITQHSGLPGAEPVELSWPQVKVRCNQVGVKHVIEAEVVGTLPFGLYGLDALTEACEQWADGPDPVDPSHPKEGVVIRVDAADGHTWFLKYKSFLFRVLEGIAQENEEYVDMEASA